MPATAIKMTHAVDPRKALSEKAKTFIAKVRPLGARVLIATYMRPAKTAGGILLTEQTLDEDRWQGKVGLVVALGPLAFKEDEHHIWGDLKPKLGDWVLVNVGDTRKLDMEKNPCRFVEDVHIQAIIDDPDVAY